jgi:hypothetical protein
MARAPPWSRQRGWRADRRVPDTDREKDEQRGEGHVLDGATAPDDDDEQEHARSRDESEVEQKEEAERVQMTLCSLIRSPRRKRSYASGATSRDVFPSTISSAIASPAAGACMMP